MRQSSTSQTRPLQTQNSNLCSHCLKSQDLCVCDEIKSVKSRLQVLILQHPQEPDKDLGSARIAHLSLQNSTLKIGLSWPNLTKALGREAQSSRWAVLYLGSGLKEQPNSPPSPAKTSLRWVTKNGTPLKLDPKVIQALEGIVFLDGTWSQAKALWWRNPWLLKLKRALLLPQHKSLYQNLRREPKKECLSTIEAIGETLTEIGESPEVQKQLNQVFQSLLKRYRERPQVKKVR